MPTQDNLTSLVRALAEARYNEPGDFPTACDSTDATEVIKAQLTENTGIHMCDSGFDSGRHWQKNQDNPPWERPSFQVGEGYVTWNVFDYLRENVSRDAECVGLEAALYAYGRGPGERESWLTCMEDVADMTGDREWHNYCIDTLGLPAELADLADRATRGVGDEAPFTFNTYNHEYGSLSQVIQATVLGGPYGDIAFVQVHGGADVRGGYTGPRVYRVFDCLLPSEFWFHCENCGNDVAESGSYDAEWLNYNPDDNEVTCNDCGGHVHVG